MLTFLVKNGIMKLFGESMFLEYAKKLEVKSRIRSRTRSLLINTKPSSC